MISVRVRCIALATLALCGAAAAQAQPAPYRHWRTLATEHFNIHVPDGMEREGRAAAASAERAYAQLARELVPPRSTIDIVISDETDQSNGYATVLPSPRIVIFAVPPVEIPELRLDDDWIGSTITHELTHIFHLDRATGVWAVGQSIFGRVPFFFPHVFGPSWVSEGIAVYYESRLTDGGRVRSDEYPLIPRVAAAEGRFPSIADLSVGSSIYPNGGLPYAYGSQFMSYLSRTYSDSAIPRYIESGSRRLLPFMLGGASHSAFGISFVDAYDMWRDSVKHTIDSIAPAPPLEGWRELTTHGYYAASPRWTSDTTLVYVANDGRTVRAAYELTTSGARRRLGRRNVETGNAPMPDGGLLYSYLDFESRDELYSDLYVEQRDGSVRRLTHGARLTQPDVDAKGAIVAAKIAAGRTSLVLLDRDGNQQRVLREAAPDETWSEPRWSPDGSRIAVARRQHGGIFSIEIVPRDGGEGTVIARERFLLSSPAWSRDGGAVYYVSERTKVPGIEAWTAGGLYTPTATSSLTALATPDVSPNGSLIAAVSMRADGFHVGIAPTPALRPIGGARAPANDSTSLGSPQQALASGDFADYSPWPSLRPRYWAPIIESSPDGGSWLGISTSGADVVGRHAYDVYFGIPTSGRFYMGAFDYAYYGLRPAVLQLSASQDWVSIYRSGPTSLTAPAVNLLKGTRDLSLAATVLRPRARTAAAFTFGVGAERRTYAADPENQLVQFDSSFSRGYTFARAFAGASWSNAKHPRLAVSPEDGVRLALTARERLLTSDASNTASASVVGTFGGYRAVETGGYAHSVLALRLAGGFSDARSASIFEVGGDPGFGSVGIPNVVVGEGRETFGVRGFPSATVYGTSAVAGSVEYRAPLFLTGKGTSSFPAFLDRSSVNLFADAGTATCVAKPRYAGVCAPSGVNGHVIASAGAELALNAAVVLIDMPFTWRIGVAVPVAGRDLAPSDRRTASIYIGTGLAF